MRIVAVMIALLALTGSVIAQDEPEDLAKRVEDLEKENAEQAEEIKELRRELENLKAKLGLNHKLPEGALWQIDMDSDLKGSAAVADVDDDGQLEIVFGSYFNEEHIFCVDAATGTVEWKHPSDAGPLDASIAIHDIDGDGNLEILSADSSTGHLYCLDGKGTLEWKFKLPNSTDSPPAIADLDGDGNLEIIVGSMWQADGRGAVGCYDAKTQKLLWERKYKGCIQSEPVIVDLDGDKTLDVIVTTWRGTNAIHAINSAGEKLWDFQTAGDDKSTGMYHGVALSGDRKTIYAATCQGDVYAIGTDGKQIWHKNYDDYLFAPVTCADVNGDEKEELVFGGRTVYCLQASDGMELWKQPMRTAMDRGVAVTDVDGDKDLDVIYADGKHVIARDGKSGEETFKFDAGFGDSPYEEISSAPIVADFDGDGTTELFLVIGSGTSIEGGKNNYGKAMAIKLKGKGPEWTTFRGNLHRTGNPKHS